MTQQEFLINFLCFVDKNFHIKDDADMVADYLKQHNKEYFEVEHIRKDEEDIVCNSQTEWENGGLR